jgi:pimeloyl-ACP methyl ester carboxylesterase
LYNATGDDGNQQLSAPANRLSRRFNYLVVVELNHHRAGTGPPLVLIHGIGSRWQVWEPVLERVEPHREVIAPDLPGFGASPMPPPGTPPGIESLTRLTAEFLDELGLERPHVAGNSLGGWIALELAKQGRVRSATVLSPAGFFTRAGATFARASFETTVRIARALAPRAERVSARPRLRALTMWQFFARPQQIPPAEAAASLRAFAGAPWFDETLAAVASEAFIGGERIQVPVTIAWAEKDRVLPPRQARRAAAAVSGARSVTLRGCGHVPTYDDPDQVARVLLGGSSA